MLAQGKLLRNVLIMNMDRQLEDTSESMYGKKISELEAEQIYIVVVCMVKGLLDTFVRNLGEKKFYYISTFFEKGRFLENNLRNLGIYETLEGVLNEKGQKMSVLKKVEEENIGKANSFKETSKKFFEESHKLGLPSEAMGIRYIRSYEEKGKEIENYDSEKSWLEKQNFTREIVFNKVKANILFYNMDVVGEDKQIYKFHLFDLEIEDEIEEQDKQIYYDYFLVSNSVRQILQDMREHKYDLRKMDSYVRIGMEGKYITFVIPELLRILVDEKAIPMEESMEIVRKTCGYSDWNEMAEAVKQCPREYVEKLVPQLVEKIESMKKGTMDINDSALEIKEV